MSAKKIMTTTEIVNEWMRLVRKERTYATFERFKEIKWRQVKEEKK